MANPRKFSEKIALHNKKQAEETAAFEAVLREVSATTQVGLAFGTGNRFDDCHWQTAVFTFRPSLGSGRDKWLGHRESYLYRANVVGDRVALR